MAPSTPSRAALVMNASIWGCAQPHCEDADCLLTAGGRRCSYWWLVKHMTEPAVAGAVTRYNRGAKRWLAQGDQTIRWAHRLLAFRCCCSWQLTVALPIQADRSTFHVHV
jgi:hypothetical protein